MNDIAVASGRGRRTLYLYFRNKNEIYLAAVESELNLLVNRLNDVMMKNLPPEKKLEVYIFTRLEALKEVTLRNGLPRSDFLKDIYEVEKARRPIDLKEIRMLKQILEAGKIAGIFKIESSQWTAMMILYALKGFEGPYLNNAISAYIKEHRERIIHHLLYGLTSVYDD
jgi:AcrR family transcriptional regulator